MRVHIENAIYARNQFVYEEINKCDLIWKFYFLSLRVSFMCDIQSLTLVSAVQSTSCNRV